MSKKSKKLMKTVNIDEENLCLYDIGIRNFNEIFRKMLKVFLCIWEILPFCIEHTREAQSNTMKKPTESVRNLSPVI